MFYVFTFLELLRVRAFFQSQCEGRVEGHGSLPRPAAVSQRQRNDTVLGNRVKSFPNKEIAKLCNILFLSNLSILV